MLGDRPRLRAIIVGLAAVALVLYWLHKALPRDPVPIAAQGSTVLFLTLAAAGVLARSRPDRVTPHLIQGAVAV